MVDVPDASIRTAAVGMKDDLSLSGDVRRCSDYIIHSNAISSAFCRVMISRSCPRILTVLGLVFSAYID